MSHDIAMACDHWGIEMVGLRNIALPQDVVADPGKLSEDHHEIFIHWWAKGLARLEKALKALNAKA